jgi:hypothetical protein
MAQRSRAWVEQRFSIQRTLEPVVQWVEQPCFAPDNAVKKREAPAILDAAVNRLEANARALDYVEDVEAVVQSHRRLERLRANPLLRWFLR